MWSYVSLSVDAQEAIPLRIDFNFTGGSGASRRSRNLFDISSSRKITLGWAADMTSQRQNENNKMVSIVSSVDTQGFGFLSRTFRPPLKYYPP